MRLAHGQVRLSPTDLTKFAACEHQSSLDLRYLFHRDIKRRELTEDNALIARLGNEHEHRFLQSLRDSGKQVTDLKPPQDTRRDFDKDVRATIAAMRSGAEVIFQGAVGNGLWGGYTDFLERVDRPSSLGDYSYEVLDTKLKRTVAPSHIIQLVVYSDLVKAVQGVPPVRMHVYLGTDERATHLVEEFADYVRLMQKRLEEFIEREADTRPIPCPACSTCPWEDHCKERWQKEDSLFLVAGIRRDQARKLEAAGITTLAALAQHGQGVPNLAQPTLAMLHQQASLQHQARTQGRKVCEPRPLQPGKGFHLLPAPSPGDLFYDIEGDPLYREAGQFGLEYLHGVWDGNRFAPFWAHNLSEERKALVQLFALFAQHLDQHPDAHIYHYAPYEITALRKITARHSFGEAVLDNWLREERFVDLYAVVRGGLVMSAPGYSIKDVEAFYGRERTETVATSIGSVVAYNRWRESEDSKELEELEAYNEADCISTQELRDWLWEQRPDSLPAHVGKRLDNNVKSRAEAKEQEFLDLEAVIAKATHFDEDTRSLMNNLVRFHSREAKPPAWKVFDSKGKEYDELFRDADCLVGLSALGDASKIMRSVGRRYKFAEQPTKIKVGSRMQIVAQSGKFDLLQVTVEELDRKKRELTLKISSRHADHLRGSLELLPAFAVPAHVIHVAVRTVISQLSTNPSDCAALDLLTRQKPRFSDSWSLPRVRSGDPLQTLLQATLHLDKSVLPVQGPPGTGKTYVAVRTILSLVKQGKRVAVTSNSHAAIINLLEGCAEALDENYEGLQGAVSIAHKIGGNPAERKRTDLVHYAVGNKDDALNNANIVGGTAWHFCKPEFSKRFDFLVVDEAGQVSLANLVGMSTCTANIMLVGDPCQLPQVIQGAHPPPANLSCLEWMLQGMRVISWGRGVFLPTTYRMHPKLCKFISEQFYGGEVQSDERTELQTIDAPGIPSAGAYRVNVEHEGQSQDCPEEVEAIRTFIDTLLQGQWTDKSGDKQPLTKDDIIVVAPFNAQVNRLTAELDGIRVGTVDKFQGQEAPVSILSVTSSDAEASPRGLDFLFSRERVNVAMSRGKALSVAFISPKLLHAKCNTVEHIRMVNPLCALESIPLP